MSTASGDGPVLAVALSPIKQAAHSVLPAAHSTRVENGVRTAQAAATPMRTRVRKLWLDSFTWWGCGEYFVDVSWEASGGAETAQRERIVLTLTLTLTL